jgi:hypothetical protein
LWNIFTLFKFGHQRNELGKTLMGMLLDPDDLARKYHAGTPEAELRRFEPSSGPIDPEVPRRMVE